MVDKVLWRKAETNRHKQLLRGYYRAVAEGLSARERRRQSRGIAQRLALWPPFRRARTVALTLSLPHEPDTAPVVRLCRKEGKRVVVPVIDAEKREMRFALLPSPRYLGKNRLGIREPLPGHRLFVSPDSIDLVLAPARAFTPRGERLGSGGGFFDRFLKKHPRLRTAGIALREQVVPFLPAVPADKRVGAVLIAEKWYNSSSRRGSSAG